ncbi:hypothetical protein GALMADRAFT_102895 [Galerina marginata CBS 339.88]|uniref:F-box domain-containing protein n=1 Tax=Galerina marginata (strain CBS 339.88) TaxID=685588 RepID=A0A067SVM2_GALM3|nr:hypothetical protein GALMADRAFT_102895 [Galerina marginata CBS 339.88]
MMPTPTPKGTIQGAIIQASTSPSLDQPQFPTFLSLPPELLTEILLHLTPHPAALRSCKLTCKHLHTLIHTSLRLIYHAALHATQQEDNPTSLLPISEKIRWLEESSRRWAVLDLDGDCGSMVGGGGGDDEGKTPIRPVETKRVRELKLGHVPSGIYDLTGGVYLLGDKARTALYWIKLPGRADLLDDKQVRWNKIDLEALRHHPDSDGRERKIVDMGLCIYEHDLVAIVTVSLHPNSSTTSPLQTDIDLMLLQFSTGLPHPLLAPGQTFLKHVCTAPAEWARPAIGIEIVGDHLVLVLYYPNAHLAPPDDQIYIWDWKTGVLKLSFTAPARTYTGLIFLTPQLILLPNTQSNALDVFRIPHAPTVDKTAQEPVVSLGLPPLAEGRELGSVSCRAEPNPVGDAQPQPAAAAAPPACADKGKYPSSDFEVTPHDPPDTTPTRPFLPRPENALCIFSMRVLGGPMVQGAVQFGHAFTFVVHRHALVEVVELWLPDPKAEAFDDTSMPGAYTPQTTIIIPYPSWGPLITRWFNADSIPTRWITTTCGQRLVLTADSAPADGFPYVVLDFAPENVRTIGGEVRREVERVRKEREEREREEEEVRRRGREGKGGQRLRRLREERTREAKVREVEAGVQMGLDSVLENEVENEMAVDVAMDVNMDVDMDLNANTEVVDAGSEQVVDSHPSTSAIGNSVTSVEDEEARRPFDDHEVLPVSNEDNDERGAASPTPSPSFPTLEPYTPPPLPFARLWCVTSSDSEPLEPSAAFAEPVHGALPYVACASPLSYAFDGVLVDEERIIGIETDTQDQIKRVEVHYFG